MATVQVEMWRSFIGFHQLGCYHWIMNTGIVTIPAAISHTYWLALILSSCYISHASLTDPSVLVF